MAPVLTDWKCRMAKVSICIPAYKQIHYLEKALNSVIQQCYQDYEVVITDDSPDDSVWKLLDNFDFEGRLRYERNQVRQGSPENWNHAISMAGGDYIKILHHDDWLVDEHSLEKFVELLERDPSACFAFSGSLVIDDITGHEKSHVCSEQALERLRVMPESLLRGNVVGAPSATIFRRAACPGRFDPKLKWLVDIDFYIACMKSSSHFAMTNECLVATPTNAGHQVTEICRNDAAVELFEYQYVFNKYATQLENDPMTRIFLRNLFERFRIRTVDDLENFGVEFILDPNFFNSLEIRYWPIAKIMNKLSRVHNTIVSAIPLLGRSRTYQSR